jgi:hypothetical protein
MDIPCNFGSMSASGFCFDWFFTLPTDKKILSRFLEHLNIRKKCKRHFENIRHLGKFSLANFSGIFKVFGLQDCFLRI